MAGARGGFNSRFGFIMAAVGSAVGLGNLVRFPRELSESGGSAFLLVYLALLFIVGIPAILAEMTLGKLSNSSPLNAFRKLGGEKGKAWQLVGILGMFGAVFVMFFYTVLSGWALRFFFETFRDGWWDAPTTLFNSVEFGVWTIFWHFVVVAATVFVVARGVSGGIEKTTVIIMPALFAIVIAIVLFAAFQDGSGAGYKAIFSFDTDALANLSAKDISRAVGQVFFSLSLGQGAMLTYASYMDRKQSVAEDGLTIAFADTGVALIAAMMVFPTLAFAGLLDSPEASSNFGTAFKALPLAFLQMGDVIGRILGAAFFLGLFFAALSSAISLIEVPVSVLVDNVGLKRGKAAILMGLLTYSFGVFAALSPEFLALYDEIAVNLFIVIAVALTTFFAGWVAKGVKEELNSYTSLRIGGAMVWLMRTITPLMILLVFIMGAFVGEDGGFMTDGAGFRGLAHSFRAAFHLE